MTWKAGDLALCIGNFSGHPPVPTRGAVYTVLKVWPDISTAAGERGDGLYVLPEDLVSNRRAWGVIGFRKIEPYQERFAEQLRTALPTKELVSAQQEGK